MAQPKTSQPAPTKAQRTLLARIDAHGARAYLTMGGRREIAVDGTGSSITVSTLKRCIAHGWARQDNSTPLVAGQQVTLTPAGRAHLPA